MVTEKTWIEFRATGLLLFINMFLHIFGWAIVLEMDIEKKEVIRVYPARVKFRGFYEKDISEAFVKLSEYIDANSKILLEEAKEE